MEEGQRQTNVRTIFPEPREERVADKLPTLHPYKKNRLIVRRLIGKSDVYITYRYCKFLLV